MNTTNNEQRQKRTIEIVENKVLKLHKVLKKVLVGKEVQELTRTLQLFQSYIKSRDLVVKGPLITMAKLISENGLVETQTTIMCQLQSEAPKQEFPYSYEAELRVENCLYAKFVGAEHYLKFAYSKMGIYAYENYLNLSNETYTIFLANEEGQLKCDIFAEVINE